MHLGRLATLRAVADRGTIAAAADALHLTPSAVSQQVAALEKELGHQLVEPEGRTIRLTPVASVLVERADAIFAQVEQARAELDAHAAGERAQIRIAGFATSITALIAPVAGALREGAPGIELRVSEAEAPEAFDGLTRHELDLVIGMEVPGAPGRDDPRVARRELLRDRLDVVVPAGHPLASAATIGLDRLATEPWVLPAEGWSCEQVVLGACQTAGFTPAIAHRSTDWNAVIALVEAGLGVALVPRLARRATPEGVAVRPLDSAGEPPARHLFVAWRRGAEAAPALAAVIERLAERAEAIAA